MKMLKILGYNEFKILYAILIICKFAIMAISWYTNQVANFKAGFQFYKLQCLILS